MRRLSVHTLPKKPHEIHLLANQSTPHAYLFTSHHHYFLAIQQLLGQYGSQPSQHLRPLFNGIGMADLVLGIVIHMLAPMEEAVGFKFIRADSFPRLHACVKHFSEHPAIKDNVPDSH
ncbi:hypothetical protein Gotur_031331 [Gossypium turneri]